MTPPTWNEGEPGIVRLEPVTGTITALALEGECDVATAPELDRRVDEVLSLGRHLVIDVASVSFLDSAIVRSLFAAADAARERGLVFVMQLDGNAPVNRTLSLTGADKMLATASTRAEAIDLVTTRAGALLAK